MKYSFLQVKKFKLQQTCRYEIYLGTDCVQKKKEKKKLST